MKKLDLETKLLLIFFLLFIFTTIYYNLSYNTKKVNQITKKLNIQLTIAVKMNVYINFILKQYLNDFNNNGIILKNFPLNISLSKTLNNIKENNIEIIKLKIFYFYYIKDFEYFIYYLDKLKDKNFKKLLILLYYNDYNNLNKLKENYVITEINKSYSFPYNDILLSKYYKITKKTNKSKTIISKVSKNALLLLTTLSIFSFTIFIGFITSIIFIISVFYKKNKKLLFIYEYTKEKLENFVQLKDILFLFLLWKLSEIIIMIISKLIIHKTTPFLIFINYIVIISILSFIIYIFFKRKYKKSFKKDIGFNINLKAIITAILIYTSMLPIILTTSYISQIITNQHISTNPIVPIIAKNADSKINILLLFFIICIIAPIFEEIFFRALVFNALLKYFAPISAILLTSLFFAISHLDLLGLLPIFILGVIFSYIYFKTKNLFINIMLHSLWNTATFFFMYILLK